MFDSPAEERRQTERIFTREAMSRPLFEEPGDHIVREDPFSGPQGFMIGDEFTPSRLGMAQQYFDAAHMLLETIKRGEWEDYKLVSPALFLYRHSLELLVKGLLGSCQTNLMQTFSHAGKGRCPVGLCRGLRRLPQSIRVRPHSATERTSILLSEYRCRRCPPQCM